MTTLLYELNRLWLKETTMTDQFIEIIIDCFATLCLKKLGI